MGVEFRISSLDCLLLVYPLVTKKITNPLLEPDVISTFFSFRRAGLEYNKNSNQLIRTLIRIPQPFAGYCFPFPQLPRPPRPSILPAVMVKKDKQAEVNYAVLEQQKQQVRLQRSGRQNKHPAPSQSKLQN